MDDEIARLVEKAKEDRAFAERLALCKVDLAVLVAANEDDADRRAALVVARLMA